MKQHAAHASQLLHQIQSVYTPLGMPALVEAASADCVQLLQLLADISRVQEDLQGIEKLEQQLREFASNCGSLIERCAAELQQEYAALLSHARAFRSRPPQLAPHVSSQC
jgi:hypothetical protein